VKVLGIESSCDETGVALVEVEGPATPRLLSHALHSQADMHQAYGGVVPELASRDHVRRVIPLLRQVLAEAGVSRLPSTWWPTRAARAGGGAAGGRRRGRGAGRGAGPADAGHPPPGRPPAVALPGRDAPQFPFIALLVSGGHTQLMQVDEVGRYTLLGETIDDAAGEAFDKSAKLLGLGYPGGPALAALAEQGRDDAIALPRPLLHSGNLDFSFAGLKTAVMTRLRAMGPAPSETQRADLAASTQAAIVDVLVAKTLRAMKDSGQRRLVVAGGVGANRACVRTSMPLPPAEGCRCTIRRWRCAPTTAR
jgi:N6-L-threonylcarbamoyladenine synthase